MNPNQQYVYEALKANKIEAGTPDQFLAGISTPEGAKWAYDQLNGKVQLGDYNAYYSAIAAQQAPKGPLKQEPANYALDPSIPMPQASTETPKPSKAAPTTAPTTAATSAKLDPLPDQSGFFSDMWKGMKIGAKTAAAETGIAFEDQARKIGVAIRDISDNPSWQNYWNKEIAIGEGHDNTFKGLRTSSNAEAKATMKGTPGEFIGGMVPFVGVAAASILLKNPTIATATTAAFGEMGYGAGISAYDDYKASTGQPIDETERLGAGILYGAAMTVPMTKFIGKLGGAATSKLIPKVIQQTLASNPEGTAALGKAVIENFIAKQPTLAKTLITNMTKGAAHGVATMETMELSKKAVDEFLIGRDVNAQEWWDTITHSAVSGVAFGLMTAPFGMYAQNQATTARREAQGQVTITKDAKGNPVEIIPNSDKGLTPDGKLVDLTQDQFDNAFTMTTKDFNEAVKTYKTTGEVSPDIDRTAYSGNMMQFLNRVSVDGNVFVPKGYADGTGEAKTTEDGLIIPVYTKDKEGNFIGFDKEGKGYTISNPGELMEVDALDVHKAFMDKYDARSEQSAKQEATNTAIQNRQETVSSELNSLANQSNGQLQKVQLSTGEEVNLTGGNLALTPEGKIDFEKSDEVLYYVDATGAKKLVHINQVESLISSDPLEMVVADTQAKVAAAEQGKARYTAGQSVVLLDAKGQPQTGESGQPVATTLTRVEDDGVYFNTSEGVETKMTFEEASAMLAPATEFMPDLTGKVVELDGMRIEVKGANPDGTYAVDIYSGSDFVGSDSMPLEALQPATDLTKTVKTDNVNPAPVPTDKDGNVDYNNITDPTVYAEALTQEFGEDAEMVLGELIEDAKTQLSKAEAKTNPIERRRAVKAATDKINMFEQVKQAFAPVQETPAETIPVETLPEEVTSAPVTETKKDVSLMSPNQRAKAFDTASGSERTEIAFHLVDDFGKALGWDKPTIVKEDSEAFVAAVEAWAGKIKPEKRESYLQAMGVATGGKVFLNLSHIFNANELLYTWAHEHGHSVMENTFAAEDFDLVFRSTNPGILKSITNGGYEQTNDAELAEEAIAHGLEYYMKFPAKELAGGSINEINPLLEGQDALNEAIFKVLRVLTNNENHGKDWSTGREKSPVDKSIGGGSQEIPGTAESGDRGDNTGAQVGDSRPAIQGEERQAVLSNGQQVKYKGNEYTVNGISRDVNTGDISYDLETEKGDVAFEDVPENELLQDQAPKEVIPEEVIPEVNPEIAALEAERNKMLADAALLREQAINTPGKEKYSLFGKEGALKSKAKALDAKIASLKATPVDKAVEEQQPNTNPTEAQKLAGNYKKAHITVQGMDISIENPKGSTRKGVDEDGEAWEHTMQTHYGYFKRTEGKDGDHIDVFIGDNPESTTIFVVDQVFDKGPKSGLFDESKVMIGFTSEKEATDAYMSNYAPDWNGLSEVTAVDVEAFKKWLYDGKRQRKPFADYVEFESDMDESFPTVEEEKAEAEKYKARLEAEAVEKYGIVPHKGIDTPITKLKKISDKYYTAGVRELDGVVVSGFMPVEGAKTAVLEVPGDFFVAKVGEEYRVSEGVTGVLIAKGKTAKEATANANAKIKENGIDKLKEAINRQIKTTGISPRYEIVAKEETLSTQNPQSNTQRVAKKNDKIYDVKKELWGVVARTFKPAKGSALENEPYLMDIHFSNGSRASNMPMSDRYTFEGPTDKGNPTPVTPDQQKTTGFTFMADSPMNKARALERLEKLIRDRENRVIPIYQWLEEMPRGLEAGMSKVHSRNDKGYTEKRTIGDHIVDTKAEQDYYNYLEEGGLPYSEHLKAEKVKADKQAEIDKIEREATKAADAEKELSRIERVRHAELRGIKELLTTTDLDAFIKLGNADLQREQNKALKMREGAKRDQDVAYWQRMMDQHDRVTREAHKNAAELFELDSEGNVKAKHSYKPGDDVTVVAWRDPVKTKIVRQKPIEGDSNFPSFEVEPREGIHNVHLGYAHLRPVEIPTDPKGGKPKEYINGGSEARKQELIDRIKNKLENGAQAKFKTVQSAAIYDPELFRDGVELASYFIQDGYSGFPEYAAVMVDTFGEAIVPYIRGFYKGIYAMPGMAEAFPGRTADAEVDSYDIYKNIADKKNNSDKNNVSLEDEKFIKEHIVFAKPGLTPSNNESNTDRPSQNGSVEAGGKPAKATATVDSGTGGTPQTPRAQSEPSVEMASGGVEERGGQGPGTRVDARPTEPRSNATEATRGGNDRGTDNRGTSQADSASDLNARNFVIPRGTDIAPKGDVTKIRANIAAIKLAKKLQESGQPATPEQQAVLVKYTGWGGLAGVFKETDPNYKALKDVLTSDEYDSARASTTTSFYTPPAITSAVWDMIEKLGFKGGDVLEPSAGIGHFFGLMPQGLSTKSNLRGVELDNISGLILKALYPDARVNVSGYEEQNIANNSLDLVVTNVPFGDFKVHDKVDKDLSGKFNIHDYFIAKSVRKLKPGGLGVFITTSSTMDKSNALRSWLINEGNADVIDAVRLNTETFKQAAGTEATADIIIIRKRDANGKSPFAKNVQDVVTVREATYSEAKKTSWGGLIGYEDKTATMRINKYFADNSDKMAGEMKFGFEGGNDIRPTEQRLAPVQGVKQDQVLQQFTESLPADILSAQKTAAPVLRVPVRADGTKEGGLTVIDGKPYRIEYGDAVPVEWNENKVNGRAKSEVVTDYVRIKTAVNNLLEAENNDSPDIDTLRKELNKAYDIFVKQYGNLHKNMKVPFLREDVDYPAISAIEDVEETQDPLSGKKNIKITKSDIFSKRVISKQQELKAENVEDGIRISLYKSGKVDTALIAGLLNKSEAEVTAEILDKRSGFINPSKGIMEDRDTYLSGNVREKLADAEIANENGEYTANIEELSKVIPADIPMHLIKVSLGSTWIPTKAYNKFFNETFGVDAEIQKTGADKFIAKIRMQGNLTDANLGVMGASGSEIALNAMNNTSTIIYRSEWVPGEGRKRVKDGVATAQAAAKQTELNEKFDSWCKSSANTFAEEMEAQYNKTFNAVAEKKTDVTAFTSFPGATDTKIPREHQKEGVIRSLEGATLLAHEVGTGKTITLISTAMEMRRLGLAKKPCIVVQRSTYDQFVKEIKSLYPQAKVLVPSAKDLTAAQREQLFAKIAYNDWDIVVLYHGYLDGIPDDPDRVNNYIDELIQEKIDLMEEVANSGAENAKRMAGSIKKEIESLKSKKSVKTEEKTRAKASARAEKLMDRRTDNALSFEQLGIDALLVDEAHAYKKLGFVTSLQGVKGIDTGASQRAQSLRLKTSYILENNNGKNVVFATGTPISNTMAEMWTFLRYLLPKAELSRLQMRTFDAFVNNFGTIEESSEFSTSGKFKVTNRFSSYSNVPELIQTWKQIAHTVLTEEVGALKEGVGTPRVESGKPIDMMLKQTDALKGVMKGIKNAIVDFENMTGKEKRENSHIPLVMFGLAKRAAIDVRLVNTSLPDDPASKTNITVKEILADLEKTKSYNGTIAVFCDAYQSSDGKFNIFADMKAKLVKAGIPESQLAIVNDYSTDEKRSALWDKVNRGDVRVVFGTTEKLGVGVNMQERLHMLVHLDAPIRPSDYQQRNGRIMRQGNLHLELGETIRILRVGVEQTLDVTGYQRLEIKKKFIDQIMKGDVTHRSIEEVEVEGSDSNNFSQMMASLSGSQAALALSLEQNKLRKLENAKAYHEQNQIHMSSQVRNNENIIRTTGSMIADFEASKAKTEEVFPAKRVESVTYGNTTATTDDDIANLLNKTINKTIDKEVEGLRSDNLRSIADLKTKMTINGVPFDIEVQLRKELDATTGKYTVRKMVSYRCHKLEDMEGIAGARVENVLNVVDKYISLKEFDDKISKRRIAIDKATRENEMYRPQIGQAFPKQKELETTQQKLRDLEEQMKTELAAIEAAEASEKVDAIDISGSVEQETDSNVRFRQIAIPQKPNFKDFNGDLKAYANALKDYQNKTSEVVPEMVDAMNEAMGSDVDEFLRKRQDADRPIRQLQIFVAENDGKVTDAQDVYNDKNRSVGRSTHKAQEFERVEMKNLTEAYRTIIKTGKLSTLPEVPLSPDTTESIRKIGAYLQAKDIEESISLGLVDRGELGFLQDVGVSHEEYIRLFESAVPVADVQKLTRAVKEATQYGLDEEYKAGLMSLDSYTSHSVRSHYVPQRGWEERDSKQGETHYLKQGHVYGDPYNAVLVKAKGRESLASDPLKYIQSMGHSAILTAEKNIYKQKALSLVKENIEIGRATGAFNFKRVWYINSKTQDADGNTLYDEVFERPAQQLFEEDALTYERIKELRDTLKQVRKEYKSLDPADPDYTAIKSALQTTEKELLLEIQDNIDNINIKTKVNDAYKRQRTTAEGAQHEVIVYDNGERLVVYFSDERVANAINNKSEEFTLPRFLQVFGKATRWYSSIMTQYNPAFAGWNFMRDIQLANVALFAEHGAAFTAEFNKIILDPKTSTTVWRHIAGKEDYSKFRDILLKEFFEDGSATGFTYLKDLDQIQKDLRKAIEPSLLKRTLGNQAMLLNGKAVGKAFAALTEYSELVTRFATYKTARDMGLSRERAASIAKDVTVNFNRKGSDVKILSSMFAFFNASVQGVYRASSLAKYGKVFGSVIALMVVSGFIDTLFNPNDPEEEKNWSEFDRMQNVIIGGVKLPVTHFFRGFWAFGVQAALAYKGEKSIANAIFDAGRNMGNELAPANMNPLNFVDWTEEAGLEGRFPRELIPSVVTPMADVMMNESYTGATVYREAFTDEDKTPQAFLGKRDVSPLAQSISNSLLELGGGDKNIKDLYTADGDKINTLLFDVNPSAMEYLLTSYTGGVGKFVMDSYKSIAHTVETGEVDFTKLPVINRAVKPYNEEKVFFGKYYELINRLDQFEYSIRERRKSFIKDNEVYSPAVNAFVNMLGDPVKAKIARKTESLKNEVETLQETIGKMRVSGKTAEADKYNKQLTSKIKEVDVLLNEWNNIKE